MSATTGLSAQTGIYASALGLWRDALNGQTFDQAALTRTFGITHSFLNRDVASLSGQIQGFWLGHDPYRTSYAAIGQYTHRLPQGAALSLSAQYARLHYSRDAAYRRSLCRSDQPRRANGVCECIGRQRAAAAGSRTISWVRFWQRECRVRSAGCRTTGGNGIGIARISRLSRCRPAVP